MTLVLQYIARSDRGLVRSNNEDSVYAGARLLALADGMGGHAAGEVASQLMIQSLRSLDDDEVGGDLLAALERAMHAGNAAIAHEVEHNPELDGMGTTLSAILFAGNRIGLCHVGDSRGYLYRDGELTQITRDDTFVQTLVDEGRITAEQAHSHPQRSLIMKALTGQEVEPTLTVREARAGDRYLLCSDGLSDVVSDKTIGETLGEIRDHRECADRLIELALRSGGPDNVTVVVADVVDTEYGESRPIIGGAAGTDDQAGYVPNTKTPAGRAAALRPPAEPPARPRLSNDDVPAKPRSKWRWPIVGLIVLVIIVAIISAFLLIRANTMSKWYVATSDNEIIIKKGTPDSWNESDSRVCIEGETLTHVPYGEKCSEPTRALTIDDLQGISRDEISKGLSVSDRKDALDRLKSKLGTEKPETQDANTDEPNPTETKAPAAEDNRNPMDQTDRNGGNESAPQDGVGDAPAAARGALNPVAPA